MSDQEQNTPPENPQAQQGADKRRFKRLSTSLIAKIRQRRASSDTRIMAAHSHVTNISIGGVFIETPTPFSKDTIVELDFAIPGYADRIHATGVVRWSSASGQMKGMGIEFIEVSIAGKEAINGYIATRVSSEVMTAVTKTDAHKSLLKLYARKMGEIYPMDVLQSFLGMDLPSVVAVLKDFEAQGLVKIEGAEARLLKAEDPKLLQDIEEWAGKQPG
jgi:uncharacterized protein (TIGR02266 family)